MITKNKPICVVLTGAGISAESGIPTFRAEDGQGIKSRKFVRLKPCKRIERKC